MKRWAYLLAALLLLGAPASAHEVRPAYLELVQIAADGYEVLWKVPALGDRRLAIYVELPADAESSGEPRGTFTGGAYVERRVVRCPGGLGGRTIRIAGLEATRIDVLVRVVHASGAMQVVRLLPGAPSFVVATTPDALDVVRTYSVLGIEHILTGIDHLLFVLGLLLITRGGWRLVKTVTGFTVSHSLTLTAATLGWVNVPPPPVEAVIALSIVFVAAEIVHQRRGVEGVTARAPWVVAFGFGLMHGLGFAGGLSAAGLPPGHIPTALLCFSLGVETGHLLFVGGVLALTALVRRVRYSWPVWVELVPPYAIGTLAMFWVIERVAGF
jgi:hypothetical protein